LQILNRRQLRRQAGTTEIGNTEASPAGSEMVKLRLRGLRFAAIADDIAVADFFSASRVCG
jgi:hypothetical protein